MVLNTQNLPQATLIRTLLVGGIFVIGVLTVLLAVILPMQRADIRNKASSTAFCTQSLTIQPSGCKSKCAVNEDCMSGTKCYKARGQAEGVCWNATFSSQSPCQGTAP